METVIARLEYGVAVVAFFASHTVESHVTTVARGAIHQHAGAVADLAVGFTVRTTLRGLIAVVAGFIGLEYTVTACGNHTVIRAAIIIVAIAVVTGLALLQNPITAACALALVGAVVIIHVIAIITGFDPSKHDPITATCIGAVVGAWVCVIRIAVVAFLIALNDIVATRGPSTGVGAVVCGI